MELEYSAPKKLKQSDIGTFFGARPKGQPNDNRIPNAVNTCKERLLLDCSGQQSIVDGLNVMNEKDFEQRKKKFETVYFLVNNEMSLNTYQKLLKGAVSHCVHPCCA